MPSLHIDISQEARAYIQQEVASGRVKSEGELIELMTLERMRFEAEKHGASLEEYLVIKQRVDGIRAGTADLISEAEGDRRRAEARKKRRDG